MMDNDPGILSKDAGEKPAKKAKGKLPERDLSRYRRPTRAAFGVGVPR